MLSKPLFSWIVSSPVISIQEPAHIQESEIPLPSKDHSCHQNVDLFACNGLESHISTNVSQVHEYLWAPEGGEALPRTPPISHNEILLDFYSG